MVLQFRGIKEKKGNEHIKCDWLQPVLDYYVRLNVLASAPTTTPNEVRLLADEAANYMRENRLKGIRVAEEARTLANLLRETKST